MLKLTDILKRIGKHIQISNEEISGWRVKKYADGEVEIRSTFITTSTYAITTAYGSVYRMNGTFNISLPITLVDYTESQAFVSILAQGLDFAGGVRVHSPNLLSFFWANPVSYTTNAGARIQILVKGKWK